MKEFLNPDLLRFLSLTLFPVIIVGVGVIVLQILHKKGK